MKTLDLETAWALRQNKVGVLATDTVYGIVGKLDSKEAIQRIYNIKSRDLDKPIGTILIANTKQIAHLVPSELLHLAEKHWPGPVSIVLPIGDELHYAHRGLRSLAFRIPNDTMLQELLSITGPLATSSANPQGEVPAASIDQARAYFGDTVDFYVDGGDLGDRKASRIIAITPDGSEVIVRT